MGYNTTSICSGSSDSTGGSGGSTGSSVSTGGGGSTGGTGGRCSNDRSVVIHKVTVTGRAGVMSDVSVNCDVIITDVLIHRLIRVPVR